MPVVAPLAGLEDAVGAHSTSPRSIIAMPTAPRRGRPRGARSVRGAPACRHGRCRACSSCSTAASASAGCARSTSADLLRRAPISSQPDAGMYLAGPGRAGHRRRRVDRQRAVPPGRACARPRAADPASATARTASSTSPTQLRDVHPAAASARRSSPTSATPSGSRASSQRRASGDRLPRRGAQARAADGGASRGGGHQQRPRHARRWSTPRVARRRRALRPDLDRQGGGADQHHGRDQAGGRDDRAPTPRARTDAPSSSVRFGNVLGSRGSVVPFFKQQIERGGPVTITHPDMQPLLHDHPRGGPPGAQAGGLARGGELFVLNMGEPVRIVDLAQDLIRLSGLRAGGRCRSSSPACGPARS